VDLQLLPIKNLTSLEPIEVVESTVSAPSPLPNSSENTLLELTEHYRPRGSEEFTQNSTNLTSPEFIFDFQNEASVDSQFQFTPELLTPPMVDDSRADPDAQDQASLTRIPSPSYIDCDYLTQDVEYHNGLISNSDLGDSFSMPLFYPETCTTSFQVTQLLEVAKQKEHAARLLQEAARCREYTVHSLLSSQGGWGVHSSTYPFDSFPTGPTYPHDPNQGMWDSRGTAIWNSAPNMPTTLPVT
jgi:hypothetical protein